MPDLRCHISCYPGNSVLRNVTATARIGRKRNACQCQHGRRRKRWEHPDIHSISKGRKIRNWQKTEVLLGDVLSMECTDQTVVSRLKTVKLLRGSLKKRYVISILEVISRIHEIYPNLTVENMGETDLIITIEDQKKNGKVIPFLKSVFVLLVTFIGAGFSIMSFNNDVDVPKLFNQIYFLVTGNRSDGFGILELTYCIRGERGNSAVFQPLWEKTFYCGSDADGSGNADVRGGNRDDTDR